MELLNAIGEILESEKNWKWRYGRLVMGLVVWFGINIVLSFVYPIMYYTYPIPLLMIVFLIICSIADRGDWNNVGPVQGLLVFYLAMLFCFLLLVLSLVVDIPLNVFAKQTISDFPLLERTIWVICATPFVTYAMRRSKYFVERIEVGTVRINIKEWQEKLGPELFSNVILLTSALNKLYALWDLMYLTNKVDKELVTARSARNRCTAITLSVGILQELYEVLTTTNQYIKKGQITHTMIKNLLKVYHSRQFSLKDYRNDVSFHLGKRILGFDLLSVAENEVNLIKYDSDIQRDFYYDFSDEIISRAFFRKKYADLIERIETEGEEFDSIYAEKMNSFFDYIHDVHTNVIKHGGELIVCIMEEFQLTAEPIE